MRRVVVPLLAVLSLLPALAVAPVGATADPPTIEMYGCTVHYGEVPIDYAEALLLMPPGFTPNRHFAARNLPALAILFVYGERCERAVLPDGTEVSDFHDVVHGIFVQAPPEHTSGSWEGIVTGFCTSSPEAAAYLRAWNLADDGTCQITSETVAVDGLPLAGTTVAAGTTSAELSVVTQAQANDVTSIVPFRLFGLDDAGAVTNYADYVLYPRTGHPAAVTAALGPGLPAAAGPVGLGTVLTVPPEQLLQTLSYHPVA